MMSDVPWAVAWYGQRQCVWLTLDAQDEFFAINDYIKPVQALYLTPKRWTAGFVSDWIEAHEFSWGSFIIQAVCAKPDSRRLSAAPRARRLLPERLFLTDRERWNTAQ
jgi:hypothetical protein